MLAVKEALTNAAPAPGLDASGLALLVLPKASSPLLISTSMLCRVLALRADE
ncbi:hypothetical protein [Chelativorans xinjiangense]|uniref:hypothetical protein n=1 Tax=Chelativorans xinjiangense TaxID=2681485 RepID=UPI001359114F|nr:hypothetical protein [Chelativorans xinjiangense]